MPSFTKQKEGVFNTPNMRKTTFRCSLLLAVQNTSLPCLSLYGSMLINFVYSPRKASLTVPVGPFTLLGDNDFGQALVFRVFIIIIIPVKHDDDIGILLDGSGFTQVRHDRPMIRPLLRCTRQLRKGYNWTIQFPGPLASGPRDILEDFLLAVLSAAFRVHQLQIVNHDHVEPPLRLHPAALGTNVRSALPLAYQSIKIFFSASFCMGCDQ